VIVLRNVIGDELRRRRQDQGRTLRDISGAASVSLGYLSEVERGQKEASSELIAAICGALEVSLSDVLASVSSQVAQAESAEPINFPLPARSL
jgi:transcriptional regulator with XRE-family HTH domain